MVDAGTKLKSSSVTGKARVATIITEELGFAVVLADICNYVGEGKPERHPCLKRETKKVGINSFVFQGNDDKVASLIFLEDFANSLI
jgi:hypothetical protein